MELLTEMEQYFRETREQIRLKVKGKEGKFIILQDFEKKRETVIHHSVIQENDFEVTDDMLSVPQETYKCWFHNRPRVFAKVNKWSAERAEIIKANILLLMKYKNEILGSPRFRNILAFDDFYTSPVGMPKNKVITLGELLQIWDLEPAFSAECECGGKAYVYRFEGSIYSSKLTKHFWCSNCGKVFIDKKIKERFKELAQIRGKYSYKEYIIYALHVPKLMIRKFKRNG